MRYLVSKFNNAGSIIDLPRSGRPRSTTDEHSALSVVQEAESEANLSVGKNVKPPDMQFDVFSRRRN